MLYHVRMDVRIPPDMDAETKAVLLAREKAYAQDEQRAGRWVHLWRVVGEYANVSVFDVESFDTTFKCQEVFRCAGRADKDEAHAGAYMCHRINKQLLALGWSDSAWTEHVVSIVACGEDLALGERRVQHIGVKLIELM